MCVKEITKQTRRKSTQMKSACCGYIDLPHFIARATYAQSPVRSGLDSVFYLFRNSSLVPSIVSFVSYLNLTISKYVCTYHEKWWVSSESWDCADQNRTQCRNIFGSVHMYINTENIAGFLPLHSKILRHLVDANPCQNSKLFGFK